ncbi:MAG: ATP-binding cassette domain-containing protein [Spirochaetaceae bacterium]|jgi:oligopeptide transport system ATP-binding protein|nr:ATP-binding cassette domain-containing protein [Spirochaetaceae bacterium]
MEEVPLLDVENIRMYFPVTKGVFKRKTAELRAVDGVSFQIKKGKTLGLVGESGCGKSTTGRCILRLYRNMKGKVSFDGIELTELSESELRNKRRDMQIILQDPIGSLDPRMTAGEIIGEPLKTHTKARGSEYRDKVADLFRMVELDPAMYDRYPHEFSGGQRQRIGIARALALRPKFVVCDEPVSALDVSIQAQIIAKLEELRDELALTYLFIAHDLSVVRNISDNVAVMYLGKIVEITQADKLYANPMHPYTISLLSAVPIPNPKIDRGRKRILLKGDVPSPVNPPPGCRFHPRCPNCTSLCRETEPPLTRIDPADDHWVACHNSYSNLATQL